MTPEKFRYHAVEFFRILEEHEMRSALVLFSTAHTMAKPTTAEVFRADGPFVGTSLQGAFLAQLDAAFHRGVATSPNDWDNAAAYYPAGQRWNNWAEVFHANSVEGFPYGFPYDDVNSQSSVLILNNPQPLTNLTLTLTS